MNEMWSLNLFFLLYILSPTHSSTRMRSPNVFTPYKMFINQLFTYINVLLNQTDAFSLQQLTLDVVTRVYDFCLLGVYDVNIVWTVHIGKHTKTFINQIYSHTNIQLLCI